MTRDPVREALVSARTRAWLAYVDAPGQQDALFDAWEQADKAVIAYDARRTPAASSDAGATPTEGNP